MRDVACAMCGGKFFPSSLPFHQKACAKRAQTATAASIAQLATDFCIKHSEQYQMREI